jgi:DNA polymerase-3 subunit beta
MRFQCEAPEMMNALNTVSRALAVRSTMPVLEGILLESCADGLRLMCTDMALSIETVIPAAIEEEGRAVMPGKLFLEVIRKLPSDTVSISVNERYAATIRCQSSRTTLSGMNPMEFPELPEIEGGSQVCVPQNLMRDMITKTSFAIGTDESRPILTGSLLEIEPDEMRLIALDGFRLAIRREKLNSSSSGVQAVIGGKMISDLSKVLSDTDEEAGLVITRTHLCATMGKTRVITRLLEGEYIRYRQILPTDFQTRVTVRRAQLSEAIERASLIAREGKNNLVRFKIEGDSMTLSSNAELGDVQEQIDVVTEGKDIEIAFNVRYISDVLKVLADENVCMRFNSNVSPCVICPQEGDAYIYLVLPVRVFAS